MKSGFVPSYVSKSRHGIYYFRCRIPLSVRNKYNLSKAEIKKSLHTSNHSDAVKKARRLWIELIDEDSNETDHSTMIAIGKPKGKIDLILHLPKAVGRIRELYGVSGDDSTIPYMSHYLSKLGDDPDVVAEFISHLTEDEKKKLTEFEPYKRACLIIKYHQNHTQPVKNQRVETIPVNPNELTKISISKAIDTYYKWYISDREENKNKKVPPKTKDDKTRTLKTFCIILKKHQHLYDLTPGIIENEYVVKAKRIPARLNNIYKYHPAKKNHEILELHIDEILNIGITKDRFKKSNDTLNREFVSIKMFLKWAEERNYIKTGLGNFIPSMAENTENAQPKPTFTDNDLTLLFNSKHYTQGTFTNMSDFWIPLMAIFYRCKRK